MKKVSEREKGERRKVPKKEEDREGNKIRRHKERKIVEISCFTVLLSQHSYLVQICRHTSKELTSLDHYTVYLCTVHLYTSHIYTALPHLPQGYY